MKREPLLDIAGGFRLLRLDQPRIRSIRDAVQRLVKDTPNAIQSDVEWTDTVNNTRMRSTDAKLESDS